MTLNVLPLLNYISGLFDPYGTDHGLRVAELAKQLAIAAGYGGDPEFMETLSLGAVLHDLGKMGVPEYVRRQPGRYTEAERMLMQQHASIGASILRYAINGMVDAEVIKIVKYHHEDYQGTGYPDGLSGDAIPYKARLIAICDRFDAMTHARGYRHAMTASEALQEMIDTQIKTAEYDPELFRLFLKLRRDT